MKRLFEENQKYPDETKTTDIAQYSDKTKIVVTKHVSPSESSSTMAKSAKKG